jgi:hypothetical protein
MEPWKGWYCDGGTRWMVSVDVPDLELFPKRYGVRNATFYAGLELSLLHLGTCAIATLPKWGYSKFLDLSEFKG